LSNDPEWKDERVEREELMGRKNDLGNLVDDDK
jgi:hypothetical protein